MESVRLTAKYRQAKHTLVYTKMIDRNKPLRNVKENLRGGVRLIVDIPSCYAALGQIHTHWPIPANSTIIAVPKDNFYQSLHTAVYYDDDKPSVQIRTQMSNAEYGIAAVAL